jgi:hypothetical protein
VIASGHSTVSSQEKHYVEEREYAADGCSCARRAVGWLQLEQGHARPASAGIPYRRGAEVWAFRDNRIAVRFAYEWHDDSGQWFRSYGNENWEFDATTVMLVRKKTGRDEPAARPSGKRAYTALTGSVPSVSRQLKADRGVGILPYIIAPVENRARGLDAGACAARRIAMNDRLPRILRCHVRGRGRESRGVCRTHRHTTEHEGAKHHGFFDTIEHVIISSFIRRINDCPRNEENMRFVDH